jgi:RNA polymerase sigma factor (sigma-70 family)
MPVAELWALLYRQMRKLVGSRAELDDLVQAAAERALRTWPRFEGRSELSTWTYAIVYRTLIDHDRWYRRWRRRFTDFEHAGETEGRTEQDGETLAIQARRAESLYRALSQLPPPKRAVVVLHDLEGLELGEVAAIVGANQRTIRSRLGDGRRKLLSLLRLDPLFDPEGCP